MTNLNSLVQKIATFNNVYRSRNSSVKDKLVAMWEIGNILYQNKIENPHSIGWKIQAFTQGVIKRPTIFRSYKFRIIWTSKELFIKECMDVKSLNNIIEMLPLLDPIQKSKRIMPENIINDLKNKMKVMAASEFKAELDKIKKEYKDKNLGYKVDKYKHLKGFLEVKHNFVKLKEFLNESLSKDVEYRNKLRHDINVKEFEVLSNMCISLTTKENYHLFKFQNYSESKSKNILFKFIFDKFLELLNDAADTKRARLRRLIPALELANLSDLATSILDETKVKDYLEREKMRIKLNK